MRTLSFTTAVLTAHFLTSCLTPEKAAWGIPREDAYAIRDILHAAHPDCKIIGYTPNQDGTITVGTSCKPYLLRRTRHGWKIDEKAEIVIVS